MTELSQLNSNCLRIGFSLFVLAGIYRTYICFFFTGDNTNGVLPTRPWGRTHCPMSGTGFMRTRDLTLLDSTHRKSSPEPAREAVPSGKWTSRNPSAGSMFVFERVTLVVVLFAPFQPARSELVGEVWPKTLVATSHILTVSCVVVVSC